MVSSWRRRERYVVANFGLALKDDAIEIGEVVLWVYRRRETRGRTGGLVKLQR